MMLFPGGSILLQLLFTSSALAPAGSVDFFSYNFRSGASVLISDRLEGAVTVGGMGLSMNGTFDVAIESTLRVLSLGKDGSAQMEVLLNRLKGGLQFPLTGTMRLDSANKGVQADPRVAKAEEEAKSLVGRKFSFHVDNLGKVLKAELAGTPPGGIDSAQMNERLRDLAQALFVRLPDQVPATGQAWDPLSGTKPGVKTSIRLEKIEKGFGFFHAQSESDLSIAAADTAVPEALPNPEATRNFLDGLSGSVSASAEISYSTKNGMPGSGSGKAEGRVSFKASPDSTAPVTSLDFLVHGIRSRGHGAKP